MNDLNIIKTPEYNIYSGEGSLSSLGEMLEGEEYSEADFFLLTDQNTNHHCLSALQKDCPLLENAQVITVAPGEESKSIEMAQSLWRSLALKGAERDAVIINLGGGVVCDLGGFVASTFKRGVRFIQIPTSLLAMVDASVGGKTGINLDRLKNMIGTFSAPEAVFVYPPFLSSLDKRNYLSGLAEIVKHALIADADYWETVKQTRLSDFDQWCSLINRSVEIKSSVVQKDYREDGLRKILNFGHTIGHAIESYSFEKDNTPLLHGEAVAIGMICEAYISHKQTGLPETDLRDIANYLNDTFNHYSIEPGDYHRLIEFMKHDKKRSGRALKFSLLKGVGSSVFNREVGMEMIIDALNFYHIQK